MSNPKSPLPPGFRFHPTDEELILHYLRNKAMSLPCPVSIIAEVDIYKFDPWDLPAKAMFGEKEWYFFSPRDRKYPNGVRPNRAAVSGYWKATGTDKPIVASLGEAKIIGVKKALVFYKGRPPKGMKTNWIMHEYRLSQSHKPKPIKSRDSSMRLDEWVLCRIYKKSTAAAIEQEQEQEQELEHSLKQEDPFSNIQNLHTINPQKSLSFSDFLDVTDYSDLIGFEQNPMLHTNANYNNNIISSDNNNYLLQSPQQMDPNSISFVENQLKRTRSLSLNAEEPMLKKVMNTCNFTNNTSQMEDTPQYHSLYQPFLNQQLLMSSHYQL